MKSLEKMLEDFDLSKFLLDSIEKGLSVDMNIYEDSVSIYVYPQPFPIGKATIPDTPAVASSNCCHNCSSKEHLTQIDASQTDALDVTLL